MFILSAADWPEVRTALDVTLDSTLLPDATLEMDAYNGEAEREVLALDPNALTYSAGTDNARRVRLAAIYLTAARLALSLPVLVSEQTPSGQRYQRQAWDPVTLSGRLRSLATEVINTYLYPSTPASAIPFMFGTVAGCRGR